MNNLIIPFSRYLGVLAGRIFVHITSASLSFVLRSVFFLAIALFIKVTNVFMFPLIVSIYLGTSCLMSMFFPLPTFLCPLSNHHPCIHPLLLLTNLMMLHTLLCCYLTMVQEPDVELVWSCWRIHHHHRRLLVGMSIALCCMASIRVPMHGHPTSPSRRASPLLGPFRQRPPSRPRLGPSRRLRLRLGPSRRLRPRLGSSRRLHQRIGPRHRPRHGPLCRARHRPGL